MSDDFLKNLLAEAGVTDFDVDGRDARLLDPGVKPVALTSDMVSVGKGGSVSVGHAMPDAPAQQPRQIIEHDEPAPVVHHIPDVGSPLRQLHQLLDESYQQMSSSAAAADRLWNCVGAALDVLSRAPWPRCQEYGCGRIAMANQAGMFVCMEHRNDHAQAVPWADAMMRLR